MQKLVIQLAKEIIKKNIPYLPKIFSFLSEEKNNNFLFSSLPYFEKIKKIFL